MCFSMVRHRQMSTSIIFTTCIDNRYTFISIIQDERCEGEEEVTDKYVECIEACLYSEDCDIRESLWGHIEIQ